MKEKDLEKDKIGSGATGGGHKNLRDVDMLAKNVSLWWNDTLVFVTKTKVKTWKGTLLLSFVSGVVIATIWGVSAGIFQGSLAGFSTALMLDPPTDTVQIGDTFDLDAVIDTDNENIVAVKAIINYDKNSFGLQNIDTSNSSFAVGNACQYQGKACEIIDRDDANGKVTITLAKPSPGINTASGIIATLSFIALQQTSPSSPNISFDFVANGNYTDSDMIADNGTGSDTLDAVINATVTVAPPVCTDFTYSAYGACQPNNTQSRTVTSSLPQGCAGGSPILSQSCVFVAPTCTSFTYSAYGACQPNNTQDRTVTSSLPQGCTGGSPVLTQSCVYGGGGPVTCTSFTYSAYGACQPNNTQSRTVTDSSPQNCTGGNPILDNSCVYTPPAITCTDFTYSGWSACDIDGIQSRTVTDSLPSGCTGGSPVLEQDCTPSGDDDGQPEIVDANRPIKIEGEKQKFGRSDTFYSDSKNISFQGGNDDIKDGKVKIYSGNDLKKEITANGSGKWETEVKVKSDGDYKFRLEYYNSAGDKVADSKKYIVKVDTEDPKFTDLPFFLNKKRGDKIWWKAEDNRKINEYKVIFLGKTKTTARDSFNVPVDAPYGLHILKVRAYDKAGNVTTKIVSIFVK